MKGPGRSARPPDCLKQSGTKGQYLVDCLIRRDRPRAGLFTFEPTTLSFAARLRGLDTIALCRDLRLQRQCFENTDRVLCVFVRGCGGQGITERRPPEFQPQAHALRRRTNRNKQLVAIMVDFHQLRALVPALRKPAMKNDRIHIGEGHCECGGA